MIHCVELRPGKGAQIARSAGASVQLVAREGRHATLRLRSGEMRKVLSECRATLGEVSNGEHSLRQLGKAGAKRWRGVRPTVRGVVMNPVDHPHMEVVKDVRRGGVIRFLLGVCQPRATRLARTSVLTR